MKGSETVFLNTKLYQVNCASCGELCGYFDYETAHGGDIHHDKCYRGLLGRRKTEKKQHANDRSLPPSAKSVSEAFFGRKEIDIGLFADIGKKRRGTMK